ncbi:hypothetical protein BDB01DRAFT_803706 [Pilobolus umbonatus]|nr:hypothetical protein BDB01DRAFT_803706 [Pilobolus umbonatus]
MESIRQYDKYKFESKLKNDSKYNKLKFSIKSLYAKDVICPDEYREALKKIIPEYLLPLGENDLFACMPDKLRAVNLMCYIGHDDTGTPIHRDICGTMGHNVMITGSEGAFAEWIIVEDKDRDHSFLESDCAWLSRAQVRQYGLTAHVIVQRPGDLVIIPSCAYHQVRNVGVSVKVAWNRTTATSLQMAFKKQLPLYRIVNRPEVYKCKAMITMTIKYWYDQLVTHQHNNNISVQDIALIRQYGKDKFEHDARMLLELFMIVVIQPEVIESIEEEEITSITNKDEIVVDPSSDLYSVSCDFCHGDIFHRYYHCTTCNGYDLCLDCYGRGRSCQHVKRMRMHESHIPLSDRFQLYDDTIALINKLYKKDVINNTLSQNLDQNSSYPLATVCRRIEKYRKLRSIAHNTFKCSHCKVRITIAELATTGISLGTLFQKRRCALSKTKTTNVFTCSDCTSKCSSCQTLILNSEDRIDYDLVYYSNPVNDIRNWGSTIDYNINQTCYYPKKRQNKKEMPVNKPLKRKSEERGEHVPSPIKEKIKLSLTKAQPVRQRSEQLSEDRPRTKRPKNQYERDVELALLLSMKDIPLMKDEI